MFSYFIDLFIYSTYLSNVSSVDNSELSYIIAHTTLHSDVFFMLGCAHLQYSYNIFLPDVNRHFK